MRGRGEKMKDLKKVLKSIVVGLAIAAFFVVVLFLAFVVIPLMLKVAVKIVMVVTAILFTLFLVALCYFGWKLIRWWK
jgi:ABC-type protease/lipase transport system fused ATPase/permease subunit